MRSKRSLPRPGNRFRFVAGFHGFLLTLLLITSSAGFAQIIPGGDIQEEQLRTWQLIHGTDGSSMTSRPIWQSRYNPSEMADTESGSWWNRDYSPRRFTLTGNIEAGVYAPVVRTTINSQVPYGENNEAAWYGRGVSTEFQGGFWVTSDYMTLTFRPHLVRHANNDFVEPRFIPRMSGGVPYYVAEGISQLIDTPYRFGPESFSSADWGYSSVRIHYGPLETGLSTEPLTWGGNVRYPLMMSRNAPGIPHWFVGTRSPVSIPYLGDLEFRWMLGQPQDSKYLKELHGENYPDRFFNGLNFVISPKWIPNLHLGHSRAFHSFMGDKGVTFNKLFDIFDPYSLKRLRQRYGGQDEIPLRNELRSYYFRWVWPESRFELYGEFIRDGILWDSRDLLMEPRHHAGYGFGFQKLFDAPLANMYRIQVELTNLTPSGLQEVRPQTYIYGDENIRQGHTNRGQVLGAAIGPGSNSQFIAVDGYSENGRIGIYVRRLADNNHYHYEFDREQDRERRGTGWGDYWRHRTDITVGSRFLYDLGSVILTGDISWTRLMNYGRFDYGRFGSGIHIETYDPTDKDIENTQVQIGLQYRF